MKRSKVKESSEALRKCLEKGKMFFLNITLRRSLLIRNLSTELSLQTENHMIETIISIAIIFKCKIWAVLKLVRLPNIADARVRPSEDLGPILNQNGRRREWIYTSLLYNKTDKVSLANDRF